MHGKSGAVCATGISCCGPANLRPEGKPITWSVWVGWVHRVDHKRMLKPEVMRLPVWEHLCSSETTCTVSGLQNHPWHVLQLQSPPFSSLTSCWSLGATSVISASSAPECCVADCSSYWNLALSWRILQNWLESDMYSAMAFVTCTRVL